MGMTPLRVILQAQRVPSKPMGFFCHEMVIYQGFDGDLPDIQWRI
jgi:hypothetical protein